MSYRNYSKVGRIHCPSTSFDEVDFIYKEIFRDRDYVQHGITLHPGDTVFDVGANVGLFALFAAQECRNDLTLYCFEPIPDTFQYLVRNLARLETSPQATINLQQRGLTGSSDREWGEFEYFPNAPGNSTMCKAEKEAIFESLEHDRRALVPRLVRLNPLRVPFARVIYRLLSPWVAHKIKKLGNAFRQSKTVRCQLATMAQVCRELSVARIDLLKIDVEGCELEVLEGMDDLAWNITQQIVMEVHDVDQRLDRIRDLFQGHGFTKVVVKKPAWAEILDLNAYTIYSRKESRS